MKLAVGCPVFERAWCLDLWFDSLAAQDLAPKKDITLCFAYSTGQDNTYEILDKRGSEYGKLMIYEYGTPKFRTREDMSRFVMLAQLRNALLGMVRETDADFFLSWDNDILFEPGVVKRLFEPFAFEDKIAVGALMDMAGNDAVMNFPSLMHFPNGPGEVAFRRPWSEYVQRLHEAGKLPTDYFEVDAIMAVKLMDRTVYSDTDYRWDTVGEDIGWSHSCDEKGYKRYLHPGVRGIHLYDRDRAVHRRNKFPQLNYPELLEELRYWYYFD